jgi:hypothetical protein
MRVVAACLLLIVGIGAAQAPGGGAVLVLALAGAGLLLVTARGRAIQGHTHAGDRPLSARHEAGHAVVARGLGGRVRSGTLNRDGTGYVDAELPDDNPRDVVAFLVAGQVAAGTTRGAGGDERLIRAELRRVPRAQRAGVRRDATRDARRILSSRSGEVRRDAATLMRKGRL